VPTKDLNLKDVLEEYEIYPDHLPALPDGSQRAPRRILHGAPFSGEESQWYHLRVPDANADSSVKRSSEIWNRETRKHIAIALLLGLVLRLFFVFYLPAADVDSDLYKELAQDVVLHHTYAFDTGSALVPTDVRLPGYPLFLSALYVFFGDSTRAILVAQTFLDLGTCILIAMLAASLASEPSRKRVVIAAIWLAATCPFVANYTADAISEVLATFFSAAAVLVLVWAYQRQFEPERLAEDASSRKRGPGLLWFLGGVVTGLGALVRPEVPIILAAPAIVLAARWYKPTNWLRLARTGLLLGAGLLVPLLPWAARNWITLHKVQFLTARYFQMPGAYIPVGFYAWTHTWLYSPDEVDNVLNRLELEPLHITDFPANAFDSLEERARVETLLEDQHNESHVFSPGADAQFAELARERTARHPLRTYVTVPFKRSLAIWFTPRTELLPYEGLLWPPLQRWKANHWDFLTGLLFTSLNYFYAVLALVGAYLMRKQGGVALLVAFIVARTAFIAISHYTVEPRFVLPCIPAVLALGALAWALPWRGKTSEAL
jgi:4-amino-4-deoxy-L-arabinose transferase-like glycosyltransferase